jgi:chaperonin cofactor prefoldin
MTNPPTVEERIANLEGSFAQIATRLDRVEQDVRDLRNETIAGFDRIEVRIDRIELRIDRVEEHIGRVEQRIDRVQQRIDRLFYCLLGLIAANGVFIVTNLLLR